MDCRRFLEFSQRRWDGADVAADLPGIREHLAGCADCRDWVRAVRDFDAAVTGIAPPPAPASPLLTRRIVSRVLSDQRDRRFRRRLTAGLALAAGVALAVGLRLWTVTPPGSARVPDIVAVEPARVPPRPEPPVPADARALDDGLRDARAAVAAIGRLSSGAGTPTLPELPALPQPGPLATLGQTEALPMPVLKESIGPATASLRGAGRAVSDGLEPVTASAVRAVDMFFRDLPGVRAERKQGL